jgi:FkbM family methyltransferase
LYKLAKNAARLLFRALSPEKRAALFFLLAEELKLRSVSVAGENGDILGSVRDRVVLANYLVHQTWAPELLRFIKDSFAEGGTFLDIGANIGLFTIPVACGPGVSSVIAFEPDPVNFRNLIFNIGANGASAKVTTHNLALFDKKTTLSFELSPENFGDHRVRSESESHSTNSYGEADRRTISVSAERLDACVPALTEIARPLFIKMDVQGAEPAVYGGGASVFAAADVLIVEFWPYGIRRLGGNPQAFLAELSANFAFMASIEEGGSVSRDKFQPTAQAVMALDALTQSAGVDHIDLVLVKKLPL